MKNVVIVESPAKSKTIESYLGKDYIVLSSVGHIRDLAKSGPGRLGIDIENGFIPKYSIPRAKNPLIKQLKEKTKGNNVFLATDPDREGEAISYHLAQVLNLNLDDYNRVTFNEITKDAVLEAFNNPRKLDMNLVSSQETRRMLDRIIGFKLSRLLQSKISSKSAGRVQSVALLLICTLEEKILRFICEKYYELEADFKTFKLDFVSYKNNKETLKDYNKVLEIKDNIKDNVFEVTNIIIKSKTRNSKPAFITSTLQQEASTKLGFTAIRTMKAAQSLYEGKKMASGKSGLITYMRTDSTHLSKSFLTQTFDFIEKTFGEKYKGEPKFKSSKNAQAAHEAIRPTSIYNTPEQVRSFLTLDEYKVYSLIYNRALASLMSSSSFEATKVEFKNNDTTWKLNGQRLIFDGFLKVYGFEKEDENINLPVFEINQKYNLNELIIKDLETKAPSRYTEASLIKEMEELGIGRPSTYAQTISTLTQRFYIKIEQKKLMPTYQGMLTHQMLKEFLSSIVNVKYTALMEENLDKIAAGQTNSSNELQKFYDDFMPLYEYAQENMQKVPPRQTGEICPKCGSSLVIRHGRFGEFVACSNYPECKHIKKSEDEEVMDTKIKCPNCKTGTFFKKKAKRGFNKGKAFFACSNYPDCKTTTSDEPIDKYCDKCSSVLVIKNGQEQCSSKCESLKEKVLCEVCNKGHYVNKEPKRGPYKGKRILECNHKFCKNVKEDILKELNVDNLDSVDIDKWFNFIDEETS